MPRVDLESRKEYSRQHYANDREARLLSVKRYRTHNQERIMLKSARDRAKQKCLAFDLDVNDVIIPDVCPILGIPLDRRDRNHAPSLDRIVPSLGYVKGNVAVISNKANGMKQDSTAEQLEFLAAWIRINRKAG